MKVMSITVITMAILLIGVVFVDSWHFWLFYIPIGLWFVVSIYGALLWNNPNYKDTFWNKILDKEKYQELQKRLKG